MTPKTATPPLRTPGISDGFLDLLRIEMPAGANDDVLDATGNEDVAAGHVAAVAAIPPIAMKQLSGLPFVAEVAACRRWTAELDPSLAALAELVSSFVDDADLVPGKGLAAGRKSRAAADRPAAPPRRRRAG